MREILYKNLTGADHKKHDICIREVVNRDDFMATIERRCIYFVRDRVYVEDPKNLDALKDLKESKEVWKKKHFHILRHHDANAGEDSLFCKVAGTFYAVADHYVYCIAFVHLFKIDLTSATFHGKKS